MIRLFLLLFLMLLRCQSPFPALAADVATSSPAQPKLIEKATLRFSTELGNHVGTASMKRQSSRKFTFDVPKGASELYIDTCHRVVAQWKPPSPFVWNYVPVLALMAPEPIEYAGNCLLIATVITSRGVTLRGIVSFSGDEDAAATLYCDGNQTETTGHSLCQAKAGDDPRVQAIVFKEQMHATWKDECAPLRTKDNRGFAWNMAPGFCTYAFNSFDKSKWYRLVTYGFSVIPMPDYE